MPELLADLRAAGIKIWMLTGDKVGTAINIARACNILPSNADVLEITTEKFPALADVPTADLLRVQRQLDKVKEDPVAAGESLKLRSDNGPQSTKRRTSVEALLPQGEKGETLRGFYRGCCDWLNGGRRKHLLKIVLEEELDRHTVALDLKYPALVDVREALEERRQAMLASMDSKDDKSGAQYFLVIDEKVNEEDGDDVDDGDDGDDDNDEEKDATMPRREGYEPSWAPSSFRTATSHRHGSPHPR